MTIAQEDICRYLRTQPSVVHMEPIRETVVRAWDQNGTTTDYTENLYGDIMNAETKEIIAISDLPKTMETLASRDRPTRWENRPDISK